VISKLTQGWIKFNKNHIRVSSIEAVKYDPYTKTLSLSTDGGDFHQCKVTTKQHDDLYKLLDIESNTLLTITPPESS